MPRHHASPYYAPFIRRLFVLCRDISTSQAGVLRGSTEAARIAGISTTYTRKAFRDGADLPFPMLTSLLRNGRLRMRWGDALLFHPDSGWAMDARALRQSAGLSMHDLCKRFAESPCGTLSAPVVSHWEKGLGFGTRNLMRLLQVLDPHALIVIDVVDGAKAGMQTYPLSAATIDTPEPRNGWTIRTGDAARPRWLPMPPDLIEAVNRLEQRWTELDGLYFKAIANTVTPRYEKHMTLQQRVEAIDLGIIQYKPRPPRERAVRGGLGKAPMSMAEYVVRREYSKSASNEVIDPKHPNRGPQTEIGRLAVMVSGVVASGAKFDRQVLRAAKRWRDQTLLFTSHRSTPLQPDELSVFSDLLQQPQLDENAIMDLEKTKQAVGTTEYAVSHLTRTYLTLHQRLRDDARAENAVLAEKLPPGYVWTCEDFFAALRVTIGRVRQYGRTSWRVGDQVLDPSVGALNQLIEDFFDASPTFETLGPSILDMSLSEFEQVRSGICALPAHKMIWCLIRLGLTPHIRIDFMSHMSGGRVERVTVPGVVETEVRPVEPVQAQPALTLVKG